MPRRHYTFTNIHVFSGIQTEALRHSSQRLANHFTGWTTALFLISRSVSQTERSTKERKNETFTSKKYTFTSVWTRLPRGYSPDIVVGVSRIRVLVPLCRGERCALNLARFKRPPVDVVWKLREATDPRPKPRAGQGRLSLSSLQWIAKWVTSLLRDLSTGGLASVGPPDRHICSCTPALNVHVYWDGHSRPWPSWAVVPLSLV
ncbi:hypothetical protein TNCV_951731 [Trichonephila clavipes]|nr:hypothetical protein TNCV_951731 [Trichonephila clavipes]